MNGEPDWNKPWVEFIASDEGLYALEPSKKFMDALANHNGDKSAGVEKLHYEMVYHNQELLKKEDEFEFNFLTFVEDTVTPEDVPA